MNKCTMLVLSIIAFLTVSYAVVAQSPTKGWVFNKTTGYQLFTLVPNVGIGTPDPHDKLHVLGNIVIENGVISPVGGQDLRLIMKVPNSIIFSDNYGREKMRIISTSDLSALFTGNIEIVEPTNAQMMGKVFIDPWNRIFGIKTLGVLPITFATEGNERMRIDSSGNVGIGTANPSQKLDVDGTILGAMPLTDVDVAIDNQRIRYALMVAAVPSSRKVFVRTHTSPSGTIEYPENWTEWRDFGTPNPQERIVDVSTSIAVNDPDTPIAMIAARMSNGKVYSRVYNRPGGASLYDPSLWTLWRDFGDPGL